mgnify:CR=1 FL=1
MKIRKLLSLLYLIAMIFLILYFTKDVFGISSSLADFFYYFAIGVFAFGVIRIIYLVVRRK